MKTWADYRDIPPLNLYREKPYAEPSQLDERGRCCGRKPIVYKRDAQRFCHRCCRAYHIDTGRQINNWAWRQVDPPAGTVDLLIEGAVVAVLGERP